ncbi:MAG: ATP-binding protein, partial [Thermoplasmata archaeon]
HTVLFGASGSGKSAFLVHRARECLDRGRPFVLFDVHGDLGARVVAALPPASSARLVAIDPSAPGPVPGVALLGGEGDRSEAERAHLLSALRRLGAEEGQPYWGFRLDRIFDTLLRVVQEERGDLRDLQDLLVDPARRELSRGRTAIPEVRQFLDELPGIMRRNPEFLWPAAARLSRILLSPRLAALVLPEATELPVEPLLGSGHGLLWRVPIGRFGSEGAQFVTTLLAARVYLGQVARADGSAPRGEGIALFLDEAQMIAPRLLTEILTEGRKFGLALYLATQFPERLEEGARRAAAASAGTHLLFRVPQAHAAALSGWSGLSPGEAERRLPVLDTATAIRI